MNAAALATVKSPTAVVQAPSTFVKLTYAMQTGAIAGPSPSAIERAWRRLAESQPAERAGRYGGEWWLYRETEMPDGERLSAKLNRLTEQRVLLHGAPADFSEWLKWEQDDVFNWREAVKRWDACGGGRAGAKRFKQIHGEWARSLGLRCSYSTLRRHKENPYARDMRGRTRAKPDVDKTTSTEAWDLLRSIMLSTTVKLKGAHSFVRGQARANGWSWPSIETIRDRYNEEVSSAERTLKRVGERAFNAQHVPKIQDRGIEDILSGAWWCFDARRCDCEVRVPDARREWRAVRPVMMGILDVRSRRLRVEVRATENSDGILGGIKPVLLEWGLPTDTIADQGTAYDVALAAGIFERLGGGVTHHRSIPYHAWSKPIESVWRKVKDRFDRWLWCFIGGSPEERPEDRHKEIKRRIDDLPTMDEFRGWVATFLDEYNASPQTGAGTRGLAPNLVFEQYRAPRRPVNPQDVEVLCRRITPPRRVGRDGFLFEHCRYGQCDESVWMLRRDQKYTLLVSPDRRDSVIVADEHGNPLHDRNGRIIEATNRVLSGATAEQQREAAGMKARYTRLKKQAAEAAPFLLMNDPQQILATKRMHAIADQNEQRAKLPVPETPPVILVAPAAKALPAPMQDGAATRRPVARQEVQPIGERLAAVGERGSNPHRINVDYASKADANPVQDAPATIRLDYSRMNELVATEDEVVSPDYSRLSGLEAAG